MKKRISALLLSVVLCLGMLSTTAFAASVKLKGPGTDEGTTVLTVSSATSGEKLCALYGDSAHKNLLLLFYADETGTDITVPTLAAGEKYYITIAGPEDNMEYVFPGTTDPDKQYKITFDAGEDGTVVGLNPMQTGPDGRLTSLPTANRDGYTFDGWFTEAGTAPIDTRTEFTADTTVYAHWTKNSVAVTGVTLNKSTLSLTVGNTEKLTATVAPSNADQSVTWSSSNESIATVAPDGTVTAVAEGTTTITATAKADSSKSASCTVTVTPSGSTISVTGVSLNKTSTSLTVGGTETLTATFTPSNATNKAVTWTSSNPAVATVDSTGKVTAVAAGTATITVTTADGAKTATCTVTVTSGGGGSTGGGGGGGSSSSSSSNVTVKATKNGSVSYSPSRPSKGNTVTLTVRPNSGYQLDSIKVLDSNGAEVELTKTADDKYTFVMPSGRVTVESQFVKSDNSSTDTPTTPQFTDVSANSYYYDAVQWAVENGVTTGVNATTFNPDGTCTRAQMVTFLWRAAGSPTVEGTSPFTDVTSGSYYYQAVLWAVQQGITTGTTATTFNPNGLLTRAHTVTFLYRYAGSPAVTTVSSFSDVAAGQYYTNAVSWAVAEGITNGYDNNQFRPANNCTRAQTVTFLYRMLNK